MFGIAVAITWNVRRPAPPLAVTRFPLALPAGQLLDGQGGTHMVALSPDGSRLAYVATPSRLYLRSMSEVDAKTVPGIERYVGVRDPVFSPDGESTPLCRGRSDTQKNDAHGRHRADHLPGREPDRDPQPDYRLGQGRGIMRPATAARQS